MEPIGVLPALFEDLRSTLVAWAKLELGKQIRADAFFAFELWNSGTAVELDGVVLDPVAERYDKRRE